MQAQDAVTTYFFKYWSWVENNIKQVAVGIVIVVIVAVMVSYYFWRQNQTEIDAGQALTQLLVSAAPNSDAGQLANAYLKVAADYSGTQSGGRAQVLGATTLFESGKYPEAQAQFQKYLDNYPGGAFAASAALGVAASLEAQGKIDPAASAYQRVINGFSDANAVDAAAFALAKIDEQQGKLVEAVNYYRTVARDNPNSALGSEAAYRAYQLNARSATTAAATSKTSAVPFSLTTKP